MGALLADVERIAADTSAGPSAQLRRIVEAHVAAVAANLDALTVYLHEWRTLAADSLSPVRAQRERYMTVVSEIVARGVKTGEFNVPDVGIATLALLGMCNWLCQWYAPHGRLSPTEIGERFAELALNGLRGATASSNPGTARRSFRPRSG
jgi:hypothetical protein